LAGSFDHFIEVINMLSRTKSRQKATASPLKMTARYVGACSCGALIEPGDTIQYDRVRHMACCYDCGRKMLESSNVETTEDLLPMPCNQLMERYRQLIMKPVPLNEIDDRELKTILTELSTSYSMHSQVRKFFGELADCSDPDPDFVVIRAKYKGSCVHCNISIVPGQMALYDRENKRLHCLACDCIRTETVCNMSHFLAKESDIS
jgi:hypothetical protein